MRVSVAGQGRALGQTGDSVWEAQITSDLRGEFLIREFDLLLDDKLVIESG